MRRSKYETSKDEAWRIFDESDYATIGCIRANGTPYCVNVSMARMEENLYFHCALEGEKNDALHNNPSVCVSAVGKYEIVSKSYTVLYESVIIEGVASEVLDEKEKIKALYAICKKYSPKDLDGFQNSIENALHVTGIYKIHVESITGKKK